MNYTAIDFETASGQSESACSIAAVAVNGGRITETFYSLIKPPEEIEFYRYCSKINGITQSMVENAPDFPTVWSRLKRFLEGRIVIAHSASFDMRVLAAMLERYDLPIPDFHYACTVQMSRSAWPLLKSHKLDSIGDFLAFEFDHHHALEDSLACAMIPLAARQKTGAADFQTLAKNLKVSISKFPPNKETEKTKK